MKSEPFEKTVQVPMRFRDLDVYGHVNNATMFNYLEEARIKLLGESFYSADPQKDIQYIVRSASCEYLRPLLLSQSEILIRVRVADRRKVSFLLEYQIIDEHGTEYARAETLMVCFDPVTKRPVRVPAKLFADQQ